MIEHIQDDAGVKRLAAWLANQPRYAVDLETTGLDPRSDNILVFAAGNAQDRFVITDFALDLEPLRRVMSSPKRSVVFHNAKFDTQFLWYHLNIVCGKVVCTNVLEKILHAGLPAPKGFYTLDALEQRYLNLVRPYDKKAMQQSFVGHTGPLSQAQLEYATDDCVSLLQILELQTARILKEELQETAALEGQIIPILAAMELHGIHIDAEGWAARNGEIAAELVTMERDLDAVLKPEVYQLALADPLLEPPPSVNLNSPAQLKGALMALGFGEIGSTDAQALSDLQKEAMNRWGPESRAYRAVSDLLRFRKLEKQRSAFGEVILDMRDPETGRIYPEFNQLVDTGRMSARKPNVMQIPSRGEGAVLRNFFTAPPGMKIITADYSAQELRVLAECCRDGALMQAFFDDKDLHTWTASLMFGLDYDRMARLVEECDTLTDLTPDHKEAKARRTGAKTLSFGLVYGMGPSKLSITLTNQGGKTVTVDEAKELFKRFFSAYPTVQNWLNQQKRAAITNLYSVTLGGRRRYFTRPDPDDDGTQRSAVEREGTNFTIQGSSADMTKRAAVLVWERVRPLGARIVNLVHDEVVVEAPADKAERVAELVREGMLLSAKHYLEVIPMKVGLRIDDHWAK